MLFKAFCAFVLAPLCLAGPRPLSSRDLAVLLESSDWFALRDAIENAAPSPDIFFRGAVACAFGDSRSCLRNLQPVIKAGSTDTAAAAHGFLVALYMREGRARLALAHWDKVPPEESSAQTAGLHNLLAAFAASSDMSVVSRHACTVQGEFKSGHLFVPVSINGLPANYILDTGAGFSALTESEAKRLNLRAAKLNVGPSQVMDASGKGVANPKYVVVDRLDVGAVHLRSVPFLVTGDEPQAMAELPSGYRGAIGIQVLLACRTIRWNVHGVVQLAYRPARKAIRDSNLCFSGTETLIPATFEKGVVSLKLDTGSAPSNLLQRFGEKFPDFVKASGKPGTTYMGGAGGMTEYPSTILPQLALRIGGFAALLKPAPVVAKEADSDGIIGMDLLGQAREVVIDFGAMRFSLSK